jgi:hypothetical protein
MVLEEEDGYYCEGCDRFFSNSDQAEKHEFDCSELVGYGRRFVMWLSRRFITKYGFDRRKVSTKILEFLYVRYLMDIGAAVASALIIVMRLILIFEIEGVPYSGTMPAKTETLLTIGLSAFILQASLRKIREFKLKVIKEIPKLTKELGVTQKHLKKNA